MLKSILSKMIRKFESHYDYDASYMHDINAISASATTRLMMLSGMTNYSGTNKPIWGGAALAATLYGDCGPCAQLVIDRLLEAGVDAKQLTACINNDWPTAGTTGLGFRFAHATLHNLDNLDLLRNEIVEKYGDKTLLAASFATVSYPVYPLLKRALGSAKACQKLMIGEYQAVIEPPQS
ncbi:hypothetical protein [Arenicella xantha]|uniref:Uncharacterized protein n=1 Tax=Arenicella xantha TaxID=644221 RepID=A0A395JPL0_9GAMM|nr:hypothetical protein [Arenicella xantha]RBP50640.1 hypothetical protein DFR28_10251 [Arenicella xantha]